MPSIITRKNMGNSMKTTKNELKRIVKECLLEILAEGLNASSSQSRSTNFDPYEQQPKSNFAESSSRKKMSQTPALKEAITREAGGNSVMAAIFADTAKNTLPKMIAGDSGNDARTAPGAGEEQFHGAPEAVFGESAAKWAALAFSDTQKK